MTALTISPIKAFTDNYIWLIRRDTEAYIVDPGDHEPVLQCLQRGNLQLTGILVTHHHHDHTGGVERIKAETGCETWGPTGSPAGKFDHNLEEGDLVSVLGEIFEIVAIPGHTLDHIAYYSNNQKALFCGDTIFVGGCGRVFEGTPEQMRKSLLKLCRLPPDSLIYCAHEYTLANLNFAAKIEPQNSDLSSMIERCKEKRSQDEPTVPSKLGDELKYNPFLRWGSAAIRQSLIKAGRLQEDNEDGIFTALREWKNNV